MPYKPPLSGHINHHTRQLRKFNMISRKQLIDDYLDFVNNYLSVSLFAEHRGLTEGQARLLLDVAKMVFNSPHPEA